MRVRVERLVMRANVPAGCNPLLLMSLAYVNRATSDDHGGPIVVRPIEDTGLYRVIDGRHRFLAAVIAGRPDVACQLEKED